MKIAIVTFFDGPLTEIGELTLPNKQEYAKRHGYDLIVHRKSLAGSRASAWTKDASVMEALPRYDAVYWTDADSLFTDMERPLEFFLKEPEIDFVFGGINHLNNGNFLLRNTPQAMAFMRDVWALPDNDKELEHLAHPDAKRWSQLAMGRLLEFYPARIRYWNVGYDMCQHHWHSGSAFMYHPCGSRLDRRYEYLHEKLNPNHSFRSDRADVCLADWHGMRKWKGHVMEFAQSDGATGIARKLIRIGWPSTVIGNKELLLKSFGGFGNSEVEAELSPGGRYDVVISQNETHIDEIMAVSGYATLIVRERGFSAPPSQLFKPHGRTENCEIYKRI